MSCLNRSFSSVQTTWSLWGGALRPCEKQNFLDFLNLNSKQHVWKKPSIEYHLINIQLYGVAWWGGSLYISDWDGKTAQAWVRAERSKWKPDPEASEPRLGQGFTFQQDNEPKHTAKTAQEWRRNRSLITFEGVCPATVKPDRVAENLQRRTCIQIWVYKAHSVTPRGLKGASAVKSASKLPGRIWALMSI